jgi:hypothetical protein
MRAWRSSPGRLAEKALAYGVSHDDAIARVQALALRVVADWLENDWPGTRAKLVLAALLLTTTRRSARGCWRGSPSTAGCVQGTFDTSDEAR